MNEVILKQGSSYFGSGGYSAGWELVEGEVKAEMVPGTARDNGFRTVEDYRVTPITPRAVVKAWCGDGLSSSGFRRLGPNGTFVLERGAA